MSLKCGDETFINVMFSLALLLRRRVTWSPRQTAVRDKCLLSKTEVFTWQDDLPACTPQGMTRADVQVGEEWLSGFVCYGIPVATSEYVKHMLGERVLEVYRMLEHPLMLSVQ